jgi:hypothetical protein
MHGTSCFLRTAGWLACVAALVVNSAAADETSIHGRVMGQTAEAEHLGPISGATVEFQQGGKAVATVTTDKDGYYQIRPLQPGQYEYHLVADSFKEEKEGRGFQLKAEGASVLDFVMTKEPPKDDPKEDPKNKPGKKKPEPPKPDESKPEEGKKPGRNKKPETPAETPNDDGNPNAAAPPGEGMLRVMVVEKLEDGETKPVPRATVKVRPGTGGLIREKTAGPRGGSQFQVPPGEWRVAAVAPGYTLASAPTVQVPVDGRSLATVTLLKAEDPKPKTPAQPPAPGSPRPATRPTPAADGEPENDGSRAKFFGAKVEGTRIVYLVDSSNSMKNGKFTKAAEELMKSVKGLSERQKFYVLFFSDTMHPMFEPDAPADMVPATWLHVRRLERMVGEMQMQKGTNAKEAAQRAFELKPDVIYILSDGAFTDRTRPFLMRENTATKVPIHTIGFRTSERGEDALQAISDRYGGTYTEVP